MTAEVTILKKCHDFFLKIVLTHNGHDRGITPITIITTPPITML